MAHRQHVVWNRFGRVGRHQHGLTAPLQDDSGEHWDDWERSPGTGVLPETRPFFLFPFGFRVWIAESFRLW
jgi:hypothetical protein